MNQGQLLAKIAGVPVRRVADMPFPTIQELYAYDVHQLQASFHLSRAAAARLNALGQLLKGVEEAPPPASLKSPEEVVALMQRHAFEDVEQMWCLPLNVRSSLIGDPIKISRGDVDGTDAGPRAFFRPALRVAAVSVIAVHNHPSGDPEPSAQDIAVTRRLVQAGCLIDIHLADHIIIAPRNSAVSLRRREPQLFASG